MGSISQEIVIIAFTSLFVIIIITSIINLVLAYQKKQIKFLQEKEQLKLKYENELLQTQIEIQEQTLTNVSMEIHDNIGQVLSLAKLNLNTFPENIDDLIQSKLEDTINLVSKAIADLRNLSRSLNGNKIIELGIEKAIEQDLNIIQKTGKFKTQFHTSGSPYPIEPKKIMVLFRMLQEAMNNILKHSQATKIEIDINYSPTVFKVMIIDNGIGFDPNKLNIETTGIGLKSMQNRAAIIGCRLLFHSEKSKGTHITFELDHSN